MLPFRYTYPPPPQVVVFSVTEMPQYQRLVLFVEEVDAVAEATANATLEACLVALDKTDGAKREP